MMAEGYAEFHRHMTEIATAFLNLVDDRMWLDSVTIFGDEINIDASLSCRGSLEGRNYHRPTDLLWDDNWLERLPDLLTEEIRKEQELRQRMEEKRLRRKEEQERALLKELQAKYN